FLLAGLGKYVAAVVISRGVARIEFERAVEIAERSLDLPFGDPGSGASVIRLSVERVEGDGDGVIVDGAIELSTLIPFTAPPDGWYKPPDCAREVGAGAGDREATKNPAATKQTPATFSKRCLLNIILLLLLCDRWPENSRASVLYMVYFNIFRNWRI